MRTGRSKSGQSAEGSWRGTVNGKQVTLEKPTAYALWFSTIQAKGGRRERGRTLAECMSLTRQSLRTRSGGRVCRKLP